ncbi:endolytic transglycosylase MltG [Xanthovirga aplysinae]|uniref:endolytic transglycosylase MltG n=1 Tax=Xanthovirga aplysinae TaxID=2529853 RepID=UPI0012BB7CD0|nr:endolytic transglycosylase MltG [Xanthovirga aplysinae]MTI31676.1 endolytic transglycosylase MltG [Xanthovirga aplysinae]
MIKNKKFLVALMVFASVFLSTFCLYVYQMITTPNLLVGKQDKYIYIPKGANFKTVQDTLFKGNYVENLVAFSVLAKLMKYDENVKPGRYLLKADMSNREAILMLRSGKQVPVHVTFNNVRLKDELSEKITRKLEIDSVEFGKVLNDTSLIQKYGFNSYTIPAMFIPNTYEVYWNIGAKELFERFHWEYQQFWNEERLKKAKDIGLSPIEVSILASIVQAETTKMDEAPKIAGVYINRLKRNIPLQADPTLVFALGDFTIKRVLTEDLKIDSPYNTYKYTGLPPGPINVPSIAAINAVLNYEKHNYLYFCADEEFTGYHNFAKTLKQHLNNARRFQKALNKSRIYR